MKSSNTFSPVSLETVVFYANREPWPEELEQRGIEQRAARIRALAREFAALESMPVRFCADGFLARRLRSYLDAWLDTGRRADGSEEPERRHFLGVPALAFVIKFLEENPVGLSLVIRAGRGRSAESLVVRPLSDGEPPLRSNADIEFTAQRLFVLGLVIDDSADCLCKCRDPRCGSYFVMKKPRRIYVHGTYCCKAHQQRASASFCVQRARATAADGRIDLAAGFLRQWDVKSSGWQSDSEIKVRLVSAMNTRLARNPGLRIGRESIAMAWVTRNFAAIEAKRART